MKTSVLNMLTGRAMCIVQHFAYPNINIENNNILDAGVLNVKTWEFSFNCGYSDILFI